MWAKFGGKKIVARFVGKNFLAKFVKKSGGKKNLWLNFVAKDLK